MMPDYCGGISLAAWRELNALTTEGIHLDAEGRLHSWHVSPMDLGLKPIEAAELVGGDAEANAEILRKVLGGEEGPRADAVNLNAGAVLWIAGKGMDLSQGFALARDVQRSGAALKLLDELVAQ